MREVGIILVGAGLLIVIAGLLLLFTDKIPYLGKLPGDICIQRPKFTLYIPLTSGLLISLGLSVVVWLAYLLTRK